MISIIIVTYHSQDLIQDCIYSIFQSTTLKHKEFEIIIVDNSDMDGHKTLLTTLEKELLKYENIRILKTPKNLGYGGGNNYGIEKSNGDLICIMNPDIRLNEDVLLDVIQQYRENDKLCLLGYKQKGGAEISFYLNPEFHLSIFTSMVVKLMNYINFFKADWCYLSGALMFLEKEKFSKIGGFDEDIFLYVEEADISKRILLEGYKINYCKNLEYTHYVKLDERANFNLKTYDYEIKSLFYYLNKYKFSRKLFLFKKILEFSFFGFFLFNKARREKIKNMKVQLIKAYKESNFK